MSVKAANDGTGSEELTVESAAPVFERYLSAEENPVKPETPPAQKTPEPVKPEPVAEVEASPEPAETEQGESAEIEESDEVVEEEPVETPPSVFTVKVNGEDVEVTLEELQKGYSRTADYTRKTQEVAENRKAFEAEAAAVRNERQQYAAQLTQLEQVLRDATPAEPDWAKVQQDTPDKFPAMWAQWSAHKERMSAVQAEKDRANQAVQQDQATARQKYLEAEQEKLLEALPEWKNPETATASKAKMVAYVKDQGYTVEEISNVTDHRLLVLIDKAMRFDEAQKKKPDVIQRIERVKVATPGPASGAGKPPVSAQQKARQRLAKTGKQDDAAAAFESILPED